jgi:hypothetical protein
MQIRLSFVVLGLVVVVASAACSSPCMRVQSAREDLLGDQGAPARGPHIEAVVPFALLDKETTAAFKKQGTIPLKLPISGPAKKLLPTLKLKPHSVEFRTATKGRIGVRVTADVMLKNERLFSLTVDTDARLTIGDEGDTAILSVAGEDLQSVRPELPKDAGAQLLKKVWPMVPKILRANLSKKSLAKELQGALVKLLEKDFSLTAAPMLKGIGKIVETKFSMGALPVKKLSVRPDGKLPQLVLGVELSLPVTSSLPKGHKNPKLKNEVLIRAGGAAVAALANRAMVEGDLPDRYDEKGRPKSDGPYRAGLSWGKGKRPLRVHLFREEGQCIAVVLAGRPTLKLSKGRLTVGVENASVVETTGEVALKAAIWFRSLWSKALSFSRSSAAETELTVAGKKRKFGVKETAFVGGAFEFRVGMD